MPDASGAFIKPLYISSACNPSCCYIVAKRIYRIVRPLPDYEQGCKIASGGKHARHSLPFDDRHLCLSPVEHLLEFADTVPHARMHVRLRALDVVVQIIAEVLDVADGTVGDVGLREVPREQDKGDVADIVSLFEAREMPEL